MAERITRSASDSRLVDFLAGLECSFRCGFVGNVARHFSGITQAFAAFQAQIGQAHDLVGHVAYIV
jgi:hypothetical protein